MPYTVDELKQALIAADQAGDQQAASMLAAEIDRMSAPTAPAPGVPDPAAAPVAPAPAAPPATPGIREAYDQLPWYSKLGTAAMDTARLGVNGITLGGLDAATAGLATGADALGSVVGMGEGPGYAGRLEQQKKLTDEARERAGSAGTVAELGAAALGPGKISAVESLLPQGASFFSKYIARPAIRTAGGAIEGAAQGGITQGLRGEDVWEGMKNGAVGGGVGGAVGPIVTGALGKVAGAFTDVKNKLPTLAEMQATKNAAYKGAHDAGVVFRGPDVEQAVRDARDAARQGGLSNRMHPKAVGKLEDMFDDAAPQGDKSLLFLDQMRQHIKSDLPQTLGTGEERFAGILQKPIDDLIDNGAMIGGQPAQSSIRAARDANRRYEGRGQVEEQLYRAENKDRPDQEVIPQAYRQVLGTPERRLGFNDAELRAMEKVARGSGPFNLARGIEKVIPKSPYFPLVAGGIASSALGPFGGAIVGGAIPAIRAGAGALANRSARKASEKALREISNVPARTKSIMRQGIESEPSNLALRNFLIQMGLDPNADQ